MSKDWLSCYIYYTNSCENILSTTVLSIAQYILNEQFASQFFFIRYMDKKGNHIRLRFYGDNNCLQSIIKPLLRTTFRNYPIKFVRYNPELNRYGGPMGVAISEEQFEASSQVVLELLKHNQNWNYKKALGSALQLHIGMICAFGMTKQEAIMLFTHLVSSKNLATFERHLTKQNANISSQLSTVWEACEKNIPFEEQWLNVWIENNKQIKQKLTSAQQNGKLQIADNPNHKMNPLWSLYESYIHMTNNRLGITTIDEEYIAYIITCSLKN